VGEFRADAIDVQGNWVEIQLGPLWPIKGKLARLLESRRVRLVLPIVSRKRIVWKSSRGRATPSSRWSPKRSTILHSFDELVTLGRLLQHASLILELIELEIEELRIVDLRRRAKFRVLDRTLLKILASATVRQPADWLRLFPQALPTEFTSQSIAQQVGIPLDHAQRIVYCLHHAGVAEPCGRERRFVKYRWLDECLHARSA
jgi:hypothetical protein